MRFGLSLMTEGEMIASIPGAVTLVACEDGRLLGTASIETEKTDSKGVHYAYLSTVAVLPETSGRGIGRKLLEEAILLSREAGCNYVESDTAIQAESSVRMHLKAGFKIAEITHFKDRNYLSYVFRLQLVPDPYWDDDKAVEADLEANRREWLSKFNPDYTPTRKYLRSEKRRKIRYAVKEWFKSRWDRISGKKRRMTIDDIHAVSVDILRDIDAFCRKNDIRYTIAFGTLIGAVRNKGFIPWDDDIDIMMLREDYERFRSSYTSDKYIFLDCRNNDDVYISFGRVADTGRTEMLSAIPWHGKSLRTGIFIDIFPLDSVPDDIEEYKSLYSIANTYYYQQCNIRKTRGSFNGKQDFRTFRYRFLHPRLIKRDPNWFAQNLEKMLMMLSRPEFGHVAQLCCPDTLETYFPKRIFEDITYLEFEGMKVPAPREYEYTLRCIYGDYMSLPPAKYQKPAVFKYADFFWR